jgi:hypothetical protein
MYAAARVYMAGEGKLKPRLKRLNCLHINRGSRRGPAKKTFSDRSETCLVEYIKDDLALQSTK